MNERLAIPMEMRFLEIWLPVAKSFGDQVHKQAFNHILAKQIDIVVLDWLLAVGCNKIQNVEKSKTLYRHIIM